MKFAIIGSGSWGTALSLKAWEAGNEVYLYCREPEVARTITKERENKNFLPKVNIPKEIHATSDLDMVMKDADIVLLVTPSQYVRDTIKKLHSLIRDNMIVICCAKGLENATGKRLSEVLKEELGNVTTHLGVLSGPNHAEEIGTNLPAATVVASLEEETAKTVQNALSSETFRIYTHHDVIGVELAGATKNIIALAAGIAAGLELGDNLKATLLTRGLMEMCRFGMSQGADYTTYYGLAGMGDLIATCMSPHSRNRSAGIKLAEGLTKSEIVAQTNMVIEGFFAVEVIYEKSQTEQLEMPITEALYAVMNGQITPKNALVELMTRTPKQELDLHK